MAADRDGRPDRVKVLLDANALMMPAQFGVDVYEELRLLFGDYEAITLEDVVGELTGLARGRGKNATAARVGLAMAQRSHILPSGSVRRYVDDRVIEFAEREGCVVVTNDRNLRNTLLDRGIDVVSMRKQKKLELIRG
jgi:rRNA-processing protein FCF1